MSQGAHGAGAASSDTFDAVVVGSGPGGYVAAIRAAQIGMSTAIVEREPTLGGRCLHWACIPAKTVLRSADILSEIQDAASYGITTDVPKVDFGAISQRRQTVITSLAGGVSALMRKNRIEVVTGEATLGDDHRVHVGERRLRSTTVLILATGSVPRGLPSGPLGGRIIGTEEAWSLDELPESMAVVGAGASGAEIASAYVRLGVQVQLFERFDRVLPNEDADISAPVQRRFEQQGIRVHTSVALSDIRDEGGCVTFTFGKPGGRPEQRSVGEAQWLVVATGRAPDLSTLGCDRAGIERTSSGLVDVDLHLRTSVAGVYAIGDLVPGPALAHKASEEGIMAVETAAGKSVTPIAHADIPRVTFCTPNVASMGLTEEAARAAGYDVVVGKVPFSAVGAGTVYGDRSGMVKIVGDRRYGAILGAHIVGSRATELIQQFVALKFLEGGYSELARTIHSHPTFSEVAMEAARAADGWLIHG